jgi:hypothetical protein
MMALGDLPCDKEQRTDWQVAAVIDLSEVVGVGGGGWLFTFRNGVYHDGGASGVAYVGIEWDMAFLGGGVGFKPLNPPTALAGKLVGVIRGKTFSPLHALQPFSAYDLGGGAGSAGYVGGFRPGVYNWTWIGAFNTDGWLFRTTLKGINFGIDASVVGGTWQYVF